MAKFEIGEIALTASSWDVGAGHEVEVVEVGPWQAGTKRLPLLHGPYNDDTVDYIVRFADGDYGFTDEAGLRKRRPPESYRDQYTPATKSWDEIIKGDRPNYVRDRAAGYVPDAAYIVHGVKL